MPSIRSAVISFQFALLLYLTLPGTADALVISKDGPLAVREGDLIEFTLEVVNDGTATVQGVTVLDLLPATFSYIDAIPTPGGAYDATTGIWALPDLGTTPIDNTAGLRLQALVDQNLIINPTDVVTAVNRAEVLTPMSPMLIKAELTTNIVCAFCIDWEIVSVKLNNTQRLIIPNPLELMFFLDVEVINNGPVMSDANISVLNFDITGYGVIALTPVSPVPVSLAPGQRQTIRFATNWLVAPTTTYTISWNVDVNDLALLDPVLPNTLAGTWTGTVTDGGGGGCFIATAAYGSYLDPHVQSLRRFRDETLMQHEWGRAMVSLYYEYSPPIAAYIVNSELLKSITRLVLAPVVLAVETPILAIVLLSGIMVLVILITQGTGRR